VRVTDDFMQAVEADADWKTHEVVTGDATVSPRARTRHATIFRKMAEAAWICGDPGIQYDTTINDWHTMLEHGPHLRQQPVLRIHVPERHGVQPGVSLNLMKFVRTTASSTSRRTATPPVTITAQEILVDNASYPTPQIEMNSHLFRPLGLGYANLGALLMSRGLAYDSDEGQRLRGHPDRDHDRRGLSPSRRSSPATTAARSASTPRTSSRSCASSSKHRTAAYAIPALRNAPAELIDAARSSWDTALELGTQFGYRNAQVTVLAPTGTIAFMMDCDTTGIEPDIALIKYKKLVGEGFLKIVNQTVPSALKKLGYTPTQVEEIVKYIDERETIEGAPRPQARAPVGLRLRLQAGQRRALDPLHGPRPDDGRDPAVPERRDQQDRQHA
jgi:ribonucleoside-diphosphate reductase alpha chain